MVSVSGAGGASMDPLRIQRVPATRMPKIQSASIVFYNNSPFAHVAKITTWFSSKYNVLFGSVCPGCSSSASSSSSSSQQLSWHRDAPVLKKRARQGLCTQLACRERGPGRSRGEWWREISTQPSVQSKHSANGFQIRFQMFAKLVY